MIVENQFGQTDHDHLGKPLTYCAGTKAKVVVWIAESFTDEQAGTGFFAVELELLRIGQSRPAPHFRVVAQPNEWTKQALRETAETIAWTWTAYQERLRIPEERLAIGKLLVEGLHGAITEQDLPWQPVFRKGYVAFQRAGGYNVVLVNLYWNKAAAAGGQAAPSTLRPRPLRSLSGAWGRVAGRREGVGLDNSIPAPASRCGSRRRFGPCLSPGARPDPAPGAAGERPVKAEVV